LDEMAGSGQNNGLTYNRLEKERTKGEWGEKEGGKAVTPGLEGKNKLMGGIERGEGGQSRHKETEFSISVSSQ